ncbi:MAG TPA: methyltransferase [Saprospiraceae bacterium]|nr:methyltransferase [Saprospiraceae bacterium]
MPNDYFEFKQFKISQSQCSQKVSTDACLFGAWVAMHTTPAQRVLDVGSGTGLLMLMLAQKLEAEIEGIEIALDCAKQAQENIQASPWSSRLSVLHADARSYIFEKKYDLLISNPPFYDNQLQSPDHSKNIAWQSHELNLTELTGIASNLLTTTGIFSILLPYARKEEILGLAATHSFYPARILTVRHTLNHHPGRCMITFSKSESTVIEESLEIRNEDGSYSDAFIDLLRDYYLFF